MPNIERRHLCPGCNKRKPLAEFYTEHRFRRARKGGYYSQSFRADYCAVCLNGIHETCPACQESKPLSAFYYTFRGDVCSRSRYCNKCYVTARRYQKRSGHPGAAYRISAKRYLQYLEGQEGRCGICGRKPAKGLVVDHCHSTNKIRGLLCSACNKGLGLFGDDSDRLLAAIHYLGRDAQ